MDEKEKRRLRKLAQRDQQDAAFTDQANITPEEAQIMQSYLDKLPPAAPLSKEETEKLVERFLKIYREKNTDQDRGI